MTVTTARTLTIDGLVLNTMAFNIETLGGRMKTPDVRTKNIEVPGRHGTMRMRQKKFQQGEFVLSMWVRGCNQDGSIPDNTIQNRLFWDNLDLLLQVFTRRSGKLDIRQTMPDQSVRQCYGEVLAVIDPQSRSVNPLAKFSVAICIPDAFWQDLNAVTYTSSAGLTASQTLTLTPFIGATAPMEDLVWTITGAATSPKIQALENGSALEVDTWMQYNAVVPSTDTLVVDCGAWSVTGTGFTVSTATLAHTGSARFMAVQPGPQNTAPQVQWTCSSPDSHAQLSVTGRRKYVAL